MKVIIVGAGIAGLFAARELSSRGIEVILLEAGQTAGGRIRSVQPAGFSVPLDTGPEFIHGDLPLTQKLLKSADISFSEMKGKVYHYSGNSLRHDESFIENESLTGKLKKLKHDLPVSAFLRRSLEEKDAKTINTITRFVEGFDAADADTISTFSVKDDLLGDSLEKTYTVEGGYLRLAEFILRACVNNGCEVYFGEAVKEILWKRGQVTAICASGKEQSADKILLTLPVGSYKNSLVKFIPDIPEKRAQIDLMGYGNVIKVFLEFDHPVWEKKAPGMSFLISHQSPFSAFWSYYPMNKIPILTAWSGGTLTGDLNNKTPGEIKEQCIRFLCTMFNQEPDKLLHNLKAWHVVNWEKESLSGGAYAWHTVDSFSIAQEISENIQGTIYFAGEAFNKGKSIGTVEAALESAREAADRIASS